MMNDKEIWKDIKDYEGLYQISNLGNVKSLGNNKYRKDKILKPTINHDGYLYVSLSKNNIRNKYTIHRLVAKAFIPKLENKLQVNHKDGNKQNNNVNNLEWVTSQENIQHAFKTKLNYISEKHIQTCKLLGIRNRKKVYQYDLNGNFIKEWGSLTEVEKSLRINNSRISQCCNNKIKTAGGYIWKFYMEE